MRSLIIVACALPFLCIAGCNEAGEQSDEPSTEHQFVVYDFWAEWCGPCKRYAPTFEKLQAKYSRPNVVFKRVNVEEDKETAAKFRPAYLPTVIVTSDGKEVARLSPPPTTGRELLKALK
jgi:thioredoxin 1